MQLAHTLHVEAEVSERSKFCRESPKPRSCRYSVAILCTRLIGHGTVIANDDDPEMQEIKDSRVRLVAAAMHETLLDHSF